MALVIPLPKIQDSRILVVDPSASHLAYVILKITGESSAVVESCGMVWTHDKWPRGRRFSYMKNALGYLMAGHLPAAIRVYSEAFFSNPKQMMGSSVIPTINGILDMLCYENRVERFIEIPAPSWRSVLGIRPTMLNGKRDYKIPALNAVQDALGRLPGKIVSNITEKERDVPFDVSDALAIAMAICRVSGITDLSIAKTAWNNKHILAALKLFTLT